jgi:dTDP-4-amino-4,6-dideoxygalactose transaminase
MILTDATLGARAKHLTTTAKQPHAFEFVHDAVGYNYRLPNLNAALGVAQLERIEDFIAEKRGLAAYYVDEVSGIVEVFQEPVNCRSNYWLNAVICEDLAMRDALLSHSNAAGVMMRPIWTLMSRLPMFSLADSGPLAMSEWLEARVVNVPSSVRAVRCDA